MAEGVTTTGLDELRQAIDALPEAVEKALQTVAKETANRIADRARARVPVRTGRTQRSIRVREEPAKRAYHVDAGPHEGMPADKDWPPNLVLWLEFGTRHMTARPFMRPAVDAERDRYLRDLEQASAAVAEKVMR